ncbi:hypothetical protein PoB_006582000 [Plakobranchus ocellatus]|uniref:Uncharacterized protein n=1 Tax=Plakobranchus ocellatus TaxID=259542 RepID=A0AAV4D5N7_9GAST|nr:hypothetical protein PoB_006582000 [Plakobranchus ocellatus]
MTNFQRRQAEEFSYSPGSPHGQASAAETCADVGKGCTGKGYGNNEDDGNGNVEGNDIGYVGGYGYSNSNTNTNSSLLNGNKILGALHLLSSP